MHLGPSPDPTEQRMEGLGRHRPVPLGHKDVRGQPLFALQTPQRAYLVALTGIDRAKCLISLKATGEQVLRNDHEKDVDVVSGGGSFFVAYRGRLGCRIAKHFRPK